MKLWFKAFFMAWGMFLSIPCPYPKWDERARGRMLACFPLTGLVIGAVWALAAFLLQIASCPKPLMAFLLAALPFLLTGFLHLDGFSDVCDAILSRRELEERQSILKDPHIGAFGVICISLLLIAQFSLFLSAELDFSSLSALVPLALVPVHSRCCAACAVTLLRPMKTSQYAGMEREKAQKHLALPFCMLALSTAAALIFGGLRVLAPIAAGACYWLFAWRGYKNLDGMNGDISGFALTLAELFGIAVLVLVK